MTLSIAIPVTGTSKCALYISGIHLGIESVEAVGSQAGGARGDQFFSPADFCVFAVPRCSHRFMRRAKAFGYQSDWFTARQGIDNCLTFTDAQAFARVTAPGLAHDQMNV